MNLLHGRCSQICRGALLLTNKLARRSQLQFGGGIASSRWVHTSCIDPRHIQFAALIGLTAEQKEVYSVCSSFAQNEMLPKMAEWDEQEHLPMDVLRRLADMGLGAIYCGERFGGSALGRLDASVIFEALSAGCVSTTAYLSIHNMCAWMVDKWGTEPQRDRLLPDMAAMRLLGSYCLTEPNSGSDAAALTTTATLSEDGAHFVLNGSKAFISGSGLSGIYLVMCRTDPTDSSPKGISCVLVESPCDGLHLGKKEKKMGWRSQPARIITLDNCKVPKENLLGKLGEGFNIAMAGINGGRVNIASCSLGAAQSSLQLAMEHASVRKQFGKPIGAFQWTQFKFAEMATKIVTARLMIRAAASALQNGEPYTASYCAMAKLYGTDVCFEVVNQALQTYGGYGVLRDYPLEQYLRDTRVHQIIEGTNEIMRFIIAKDLSRAM